MDTGKGTNLKKLRNITCPYTGIRMISGAEMNRIESRLESCRNLHEKMFVLARYARNMQRIEHSIFDQISYFLDSNPEKNLTDFFSLNYSHHLAKLKLEEFSVIDRVDTKAAILSAQTQMEIRRETTNCRNLILSSNKNIFFKRKNFLNALQEIRARNPYEERVLAEIRNLALFLPTSGSSESAFMIKYSGREEQEILRRLIIGSVATIEHIRPRSSGGIDKISNYLLVSNNGNRYRENIPLSIYIDRNPGIPEYCQIQIDEIINSIHNGAMKGNESYPYKIKKTLFEESEGRILLDLSGYGVSEEEAYNKERINRLHR